MTSWKAGGGLLAAVALAVALAAALAAGCANQLKPAQHAISDIDAALRAAAPEASAYVPEQFTTAQLLLGDLQAAFARKDYAAVLAGAPGALRAAQALGPAAAVRKHATLEALNEQWTAWAALLPDELSAAESRIEWLSRQNKTRHKKAAAVDLDAARSSLSEAVSVWSKAQAAFATGNMTEAVATAKGLDATVRQLLAQLTGDMPTGRPP